MLNTESILVASNSSVERMHPAERKYRNLKTPIRSFRSELISRKFYVQSFFFCVTKKGHAALHKSLLGDKQVVHNDAPISGTPICGSCLTSLFKELDWLWLKVEFTCSMLPAPNWLEYQRPAWRALSWLGEQISKEVEFSPLFFQKLRDQSLIRFAKLSSR
jgi:hypothetical protein